MEKQESHQQTFPSIHEHIEEYGDTGIQSKDAPIPRWLMAAYIILPIWGIITFFYFWNGSRGWFDRGYWHELQQAAGTTFPVENAKTVKTRGTVRFPANKGGV